MDRIKRATIVLPLVVLLLGAVVPVLVERDEGVRASDAEAPEVRVSGMTAGEWAAMAGEALEEGRLNRALSCIKTAESVNEGSQYSAELRSIRTARRRASEAARLAGRLTGGAADHVVFDPSGVVVSARRLVTVLPGESLWTLARDMVAAGRRVPASDVRTDDRDVYRMWDSLTALNGVRELEVGERVRVPLLPDEFAALADANRRELDRENALVEGARDALARVPGLPRATRHSERLDALNGAQAALNEAEALRAGAQYLRRRRTRGPAPDRGDAFQRRR